MDTRFALIFFILLLLSCNKDKVAPFNPIVEPIYYQTDGNFLLLVVGDSLDYGFEFNLDSIQLSNDSISLIPTITPGPSWTGNYYYWKINADDDTLFWSQANVYTFMEDQINP